MVPPGVYRVRVLAVGGGSGGGSGAGGGGGSGYIVVREVVVTPLEVIFVNVGRGSAGASSKFNDTSKTLTTGQPSQFGSLVRANGGHIPENNGGRGGSGGGASAGKYGERSGDGGTDGSNGGNSNSYLGGSGQGLGEYSSQFRSLQFAAFTAGSGGSGGTHSHFCGAGGGGGVLMNGDGPSGGNGGCAYGGRGFGAGGAGGYRHDLTLEISYSGANGADGIVYVEWSI